MACPKRRPVTANDIALPRRRMNHFETATPATMESSPVMSARFVTMMAYSCQTSETELSAIVTMPINRNATNVSVLGPRRSRIGPTMIANMAPTSPPMAIAEENVVLLHPNSSVMGLRKMLIAGLY